ncbi:ABC transporter ATP-binding protein [Geobacillus sp. YF-1]|uniref:ABC transporter ATP-binding protein n=1 Tax=Geobacillus sp. YF-1 TaxID=3457480 RepID=UPI00404633FD
MTTSLTVRPQPNYNRHPPLIDIQNVSLVYKTKKKEKPTTILEHINLQLAPDDFVCLLGPSGCGKSSLLRMIAGFQKPSTGEIVINGRAHQQPSSEIGVVFQHHQLFPWMTIEQNVAFGLKMKGIKKRERLKIANKYLKLVGLEEVGHLLPYQLSGGMKQRAAIARTLAVDPKAILMDEPFSALDALTRETMQTYLKELWIQTKKCILFITHDVDEALLLGRRILVMQARPGQIVLDLENPLYRYTLTSNEWKQEKEFARLRQQLLTAIGS